MLLVNEIFYSVQGESTFAGLPCAFVRLAGCDVGCRWCDTPKALSRKAGTAMRVGAIMRRIAGFNCPLAMITGGEPLQQPETPELVESLCHGGYVTLVETSGVEDISPLAAPTRRIVDVKCPSSGVIDRMDWENLRRLRDGDEVKFVIANRPDFDFALAVIQRHNLDGGIPLLFSPVISALDPALLAKWLLDQQSGGDSSNAGRRPPIRLQLQLHKYIWPGIDGGV